MRAAAARAGFLVGGVGVAGGGLLEQAGPILVAEVGVICPASWRVTENWGGGNRGFEWAERAEAAEQVGRAGAGVLVRAVLEGCCSEN